MAPALVEFCAVFFFLKQRLGGAGGPSLLRRDVFDLTDALRLIYRQCQA